MNTWPHLLVEAKTTSGLRLKHPGSSRCWTTAWARITVIHLPVEIRQGMAQRIWGDPEQAVEWRIHLYYEK